MKKFLVAALALVCFSGNAMALDNEPESGFTVQGLIGLTTSKINGVDDFKAKVGGNFGFKVEYMLPNAHGTYINAGLDWKMKGAKTTFNETYDTHKDIKTTAKLKLNYLELPIHVGFRYNFSDEVGVYGEVGPYFAIGICGKYKNSLDADGSWASDYENSYAIFKNNKERLSFQRWDMGLGFRVGCEYNKHYSLNIGCDWGLTDMYRNSFRDYYYDQRIQKGLDPTLNKIHNFNLDITFGYRF